MCRFLLIPLAIVAIGGCSRPNDPSAVTPSSMPLKPGPKEPVAGQTIEKVGGKDVAAYGIPLYPEATVNETMSAFDEKDHMLRVYLDSFGSVKDITLWYVDHIRAKDGQNSRELSAVEGTTLKGYPISLTVATMESKSVIRIAVTTIPKK